MYYNKLNLIEILIGARVWFGFSKQLLFEKIKITALTITSLTFFFLVSSVFVFIAWERQYSSNNETINHEKRKYPSTLQIQFKRY